MAYSIIGSGGSGLGASGGTLSGVYTSGADLILVAVTYYSVNYYSAVLSDSKSNTWTLASESSRSALSAVALYYCKSPTTDASHNFTVSGASGYSGVAVLALSGSAATPFDTHSNAASTSNSSSWQPGSITPSEDNEIIFCAAAGIASSHTIDSGFTETTDFATVGGSHYSTIAAYKVQTTAAAINPTVTPNTATYWAVAQACFKAAAGASATSFHAQRAFPRSILNF